MSDDSLEFLEFYKTREVLVKYFSFLPFEIYLKDECKEQPEGSESTSDAEEKPLNDTFPLWLKQPKDCTEDEYKDFYKKVFLDFQDPLFWIHLNMDYPFKLKGILYFPKLRHEFETVEGQIKLFYNQVFVANNIKEVTPEFLMLLKGVLDCPELPLNVSRSFLQNDGYVNKISSHITKKVADKLSFLFENERDNFNKYWDDIGPFVKYGCIKEPKFLEKVKDIVVFKTINGTYQTLSDCLEENKESNSNKIFYVTDEKQQAQYIKIFKEHGLNAVVLSSMLDNHFIQFLESQKSELKFVRIDADLSDSLKASNDDSSEENQEQQDDSAEHSKEEQSNVEETFKGALKDANIKIQLEKLKTHSIPGVIVVPEQARRMQEMSRLFGGLGYVNPTQNEIILVLNLNNNLVKHLVKVSQNQDKQSDINMICQHIYDLAMISHKQLDPDAMSQFIERSSQILEKLAIAE